MKFLKINLIIILIGLLFASGCVDVVIRDIGLIDTISINPNRQARDMAMSLDENIYVVDFKGSQFLKITENNIDASSVSWSKEGILYTSKLDDLWTINIYNSKHENTNIFLQELNNIRLPMLKSGDLSYIVLSEENEPIGNINIYDLDTSKVIVLFDNAYYDYEWLLEEKDIAAITVSNVNENNFNGSVVIKNVDTLSEKIIFTGTFTINKDYLDIRKDGTVIFSSEGEIYVYNIKTEEVSRWQGTNGYDFRLPPSVDSSLKGYVLAKVSGAEEGWNGQLYLVNLKNELIPIQGWPICIEEPILVSIDLSTGDLLSVNLENNEIVNITEKYNKEKGAE